MSHHDYTDHHIKPNSRGGQQTVKLPKSFHQAWHTVFQNLYGEEVVVFIKRLQELFETHDTKIDAKTLHDLRKEIKGGGYND